MDQVAQTIGSPSNLPSLVAVLTRITEEHGNGINQLLLQWVATTFAQFTANQNDLDIGDAHLGSFSSDASRNLTGLARGVEGRIFPFVNTGTQNIVLQHQNVGSLAANRVITRTGADVIYAGGATGLLWYDPAASRWRTFI